MRSTQGGGPLFGRRWRGRFQSQWKWLVICRSDGGSGRNPQGLNQNVQGSNHSSTSWPMALDKSQDFSDPRFSFAHYLLHEGDCESKMITCGKNLTGPAPSTQ